MTERERIIDKVVAILRDKKAENIEVLDVRDFDYVVDYIIIAEGEVKNHRDMLEDEVSYRLKKEENIKPYSIEKDKYSEWIVMDYEWFVLHIMSKAAREFYDIEGLWRK